MDRDGSPRTQRNKIGRCVRVRSPTSVEGASLAGPGIETGRLDCKSRSSLRRQWDRRDRPKRSEDAHRWIRSFRSGGVRDRRNKKSVGYSEWMVTHSNGGVEGGQGWRRGAVAVCKDSQWMLLHDLQVARVFVRWMAPHSSESANHRCRRAAKRQSKLCPTPCAPSSIRRPLQNRICTMDHGPGHGLSLVPILLVPSSAFCACRPSKSPRTQVDCAKRPTQPLVIHGL